MPSLRLWAVRSREQHPTAHTLAHQPQPVPSAIHRMGLLSQCCHQTQQQHTAQMELCTTSSQFHTPAGGLGTNGTEPVYRVQSDFDYQFILLGLYQEWIELDLFHNILATFSEEELLLQDLLPAIDSSSSLWLIKSPDTPPCYPTCLVAPVEQLLSARTAIRSPLFTRHSTSPRS